MNSFGFSPVRLASAFILKRNLPNRRKYRRRYHRKYQVIKDKKYRSVDLLAISLILEDNLSKPAQQVEDEEETSSKLA